MYNQIENNKFYKTFTPFLNEKTKTAEKTMNGKVYMSPYEKGYKFRKEFYNYITAGGILLIPATALALSPKRILKQLQSCNREFFKVVNNEENIIFPSMVKNMAILKHKFYNALFDITLTIKEKKDKLSAFLDKADTYKTIKKFFINMKTSAAQRQYNNVSKNYINLENKIIEILQILKNSEQGKVRISFPKELSKVKDEFPIIINLNKTATGQKRSDEIHKILNEIKELLSSKKSNFTNIAGKLTYSCEDVFSKGESTLISLCKKISNFKVNTKETDGLIKELYSNLVKYRFAEFSKDLPNATSVQLRQHYCANIQESLQNLKEVLPENKILAKHIKTLQDLINNSNQTGLLEKLQMLLKCNDIKSDELIDGLNVSFLKQYCPEDYIKIKYLIKKLSNSVKFAKDIQGEILAPEKIDISSGGLVTKFLSVFLPAGYFAIKIKTADDEENKLDKKRNLISFLCGSLTMLGAHYFTMTSKKISLLYGIIAAFISSKFAKKYLKNHNQN